MRRDKAKPYGGNIPRIYTFHLKTKFGGIESPMLGASYASKIKKYHMEITHVEHTRRSKTQNRQKRPKLFLAVLRP